MSEPRDFHHSVEIDRDRQLVIIRRVFPDGSTFMYTELKINIQDGEMNSVVFQKLAAILGESILIDSPQARHILGI